MGQGAFYIWTWGATIEITENTIKNVSRNSIESLDNFRDESGVGKITITDNKIITPADGCPFPGPRNYPNGMGVALLHSRNYLRYSDLVSLFNLKN